MIRFRELTEDETCALVGSSMSALEQDCSRSWPRCPRESMICDCRLRAVRAVNALRDWSREDDWQGKTDHVTVPDFYRADGNMQCGYCPKLYFDHPCVFFGDLTLRRLCNGKYVKL